MGYDNHRVYAQARNGNKHFSLPLAIAIHFMKSIWCQPLFDIDENKRYAL